MKYYQSIKKGRENGFSYLDTMIAIVILMVGVLALASALTSNLVRAYESEQRIVAKQLALSTIESIVSARDINRVGVIEGWNSIENDPNGIFLTGWTPIREELGSDGVAGTADDACAGTSACSVPGQPPNTSPVLPNYKRQIIITDVPDPERPTPTYAIARRNITVTIQFDINGKSRQESVSTIVARY